MALQPHQPGAAAGIPRRMLAFVADVALLSIGVQLLYRGFQLAFGPVSALLTTGTRAELFHLVIVSLPSWIYLILGESSARGATLGKIVLNLRVVDVYGAGLDFRRALLRTIVKMLPFELAQVALSFPQPAYITGTIGHPRLLFVVYAMLALQVAAITMTLKKQSVHDLAAGTYVVRA